MTNVAAPVPNLAPEIQGPMMIGSTFNILLLGILISQCYIYYSTYKKDPTWMKVMVAFLLITELTQTVFNLVYLYNCLILHFGDLIGLLTPDWVGITEPAMTGIISGTVQIFFAWRIKILTKNLYLVVIVFGCAIASSLGAIGSSIAAGIVHQLLDYIKFKSIVIVWLVSSSVADIIITCVLVWHLNKNRTQFASTDDIINRLIRLTIQTGMMTAIWAATDLIVFLTVPTTLHLIFNISLSKLYTNSLMSTLNARGGRQTNDTTQISQPSMLMESSLKNREASLRPEVFMHVESHELADAIRGGNRVVLANGKQTKGWDDKVSSMSDGGALLSMHVRQ